MKKTRTVTGKSVVKHIRNGVNSVYDAVRLTLGHKGGNALLFGTYGGNPRITNDGVTISECIEPKDPIENLVAKSFKEACRRTNERAGDATTTTTVIAGFLLNEVLNKTNESSVFGNSNVDVVLYRKEMQEAVKAVIDEIKTRAVKVTSLKDLEKIAIVSVEDEEMGKMVAEIVYKVGVDGFVDVQEGFKGLIEHEVIEGMRFPAKVPHKVFVNNPGKYEMVMQDIPVLVTNFSLDNVGEIGNTLNNLITRSEHRKFAVLAPSFSDQVLIEFTKAIQNNVIIFPVKVPSLRTEQFQDVCAYFGANFINKDAGKTLQGITPEDLGFVEKMIIKDVETREDAIAIGGKGSKSDAIAKRIEELKQAIEETKVASHKKLIERRIASLASAVAVIRVGALTDAETKYLKLKVDDAVYACKGALEEGYVLGGGLCLKQIAESLPNSILTNALIAPHNQIKENAGIVGEMEVAENIIDNAKAIRLAVEHAVSVVSQLVTTKIIVAEIEEDTPAEGYTAIATALEKKNRLWAKKEGLLIEGNVESEGGYDRLLEESMM